MRKRRSIRRKSGGYLRLGLILTGILTALILLGCFWTPYDPNTMSTGEPFTAPCLSHLFGTDHFGRDIFSRVLKGGGTTLLVAVSTVAIGLAAGTAVGALTGYFGGIVDEVLMRVNDAMTAFPSILLALVLGLLLGGSFKQYGALLKDTGVGADYGAKYGAGTAILNFAVYGLFIVLYYNLIGAKWNAATLGCVLCMVCCCFKGSHPANVWPIMVGYVAASFLTKALCAALGTDFTTAINAQAIVIGLCFANGLSPVAGNYGWLAGIVFAMLHYGLVTSVPFTHGGFLLYNGGFTAGLICTLFIPVMEVFFRTKQEKSELKAQK